MTDQSTDAPRKAGGASRRDFLRTAGLAAGGAALAATGARANTPDPLITEVQPYASFTGDGVDATPYGMPIHFEEHVVRRNVEWLTAGPSASSTSTADTLLKARSTPASLERHQIPDLDDNRKPPDDTGYV